MPGTVGGQVFLFVKWHVGAQNTVLPADLQWTRTSNEFTDEPTSMAPAPASVRSRGLGFLLIRPNTSPSRPRHLLPASIPALLCVFRTGPQALDKTPPIAWLSDDELAGRIEYIPVTIFSRGMPVGPLRTAYMIRVLAYECSDMAGTSLHRWAGSRFLLSILLQNVHPIFQGGIGRPFPQSTLDSVATLAKKC
jgi:hypothetical protein